MAKIPQFSTVIPSDKVRVDSTPILVGRGGTQTQPRVTLRKDGSRISTIEIQCSCGEMILIDCEYDTVIGPDRSAAL